MVSLWSFIVKPIVNVIICNDRIDQASVMFDPSPFLIISHVDHEKHNVLSGSVV